jgi:hypothetical protein
VGARRSFQSLQCRSSSGWGILFSPEKGWFIGPTPSPSGHEGYCSGIGTRCRAFPGAARGAGTGLLITCQVPGVVQGGFTLFKHQNNPGDLDFSGNLIPEGEEPYALRCVGGRGFSASSDLHERKEGKEERGHRATSPLLPSPSFKAGSYLFGVGDPSLSGIGNAQDILHLQRQPGWGKALGSAVPWPARDFCPLQRRAGSHTPSSAAPWWARVALPAAGS